ncbi:MAG: VCBS repeat-containing protein [Saprospiraceae bacterium]
MDKIPFWYRKKMNQGARCADFNNDSYPDILLGNIGESNQICFGNSNLDYSNCIKIDTLEDLTFSLDVADFDMDGDVDIVIGKC